MSRATRHLERLLKALQSDSTSTLGKCGTREELIPPSFDPTRAAGSDDPLGKETPASSRISFLSCSESDETSTPSGDNGTKYYREETARLVQQLGDSRVQVATLEAQIEFLTNKVEEQETVDSLYIRRLEGEVLRLEEIVEKEMSKLSRRQTQVEQDVPSLEEQLKTIKDLLHDFDVSETVYMELKSVPEQRRTAREHILILAYEKYQRDHEEIQELRMSRDNSREALTRANDEVQRLTRELQRVAANHATDRRESELDFNSHTARIERLEAELRDSLVQIQVLSAKGALFDEVQGKLETLEARNIDAENQNAVMAATLQVAIQEKESIRDSMKEKDHTLDLLSMDKLETLLKLFPVAGYRNLTLQCLSEVAVLNCGDYYDAQFVKLYTIFMVQLQIILPPGTNVPEAYGSGSDEDQAFIQNLAMFFTAFFKLHIGVLETSPENQTALLMGLEYLIGISYVDDTEVFKVCLDYWNSLVCDLFQSECNMETPASPSPLGLQVGGMLNGMGAQLSHRKQLYAGPLSKLRLLMISRMAKPEEVLIVEDENGNIVRETMKDNDVLVQYKIMRETLIYLSHLDHEDTEQQMLKKLNKQLNGEEWAWNNLNTLCWAIGSISGSMVEDQENRFLVTVIRDLLNLCEITKGKDNKAVIASNIMYVVGQYPRFLRAHWKFLKTVVNKLFEFMHETHPGVQDMACDTFLKIVQKCKRKFVILQVGETEPFVCELLKGLPTTILDLEAHQIHTFYEAVGFMIQAESDPQRRDEYLQKLMELPNQRWVEIISQARQSVEYLKALDVVRAVLNILQLNTSVASSLGQAFLAQISLVYLDMLNVYRMYSELISSSIAEGGPYASRTSFVKLLRSVKRETLKLIETFVDKADDAELIAKNFVPAMTDPILGDYARNVSDARESEVLSLFATIINKLKSAMMDDVPRIFEAVFACTLDMITKNFEDYPEHRLKFFSLLRAIASHCFRALFTLSSQQLKLVMDSIIWAFRHTERNVAETGLNLLLEMLTNFQASEFCNQFHQTYFLTIEQEIFAVLTDTFHKPGFKLHVLILQHLFCLVDSGALTLPLWDSATLGPTAFPNNMEFVRDYSIKLLGTSFPNMTPLEVTTFVNGLFDTRGELGAFKNQLRDFLIQSKEFSAQDNKDLYAEEAAAQREAERRRMLSIPGLIAPVELQDDMTDQ